MHDIGKIGIPDRILLKPGPLTPAERVVMETHVNKGVVVLQRMLGDFQLDQLPDADVMLNVVAAHHECLDGSGYPNRLSGDAVPLEARIIAVADVFDALISERPYKKPLSLQASLATLARGRGTHFEPALLDCFTGIAADLYDQYGDADGDAAREELQRLLDRHFRRGLPGLAEGT